MAVTEAIKLFSPLFDGSDMSWAWICDVTNGRPRAADFEMTEAQKRYAYEHGYLYDR